MLGDRCLNLRSESGFDDEFPAYITEVTGFTPVRNIATRLDEVAYVLHAGAIH